MNAAKELVLSNPAYLKAVEFHVWQVYLQDLAKGDYSTQYFVPDYKQDVVADITVWHDGVLSGMQESEWFMNKCGVNVLKKKKDGSLLKKGDVVMRLKGPADKILASERTLLNLLQRMSGVATHTKRYSIKLPKSIKLLATRKTLWGLLDKRAVSVGGGGTHRLNLSDAILIKDNHLDLIHDLERCLWKVFEKAPIVRFIEIEFDDVKRVESFFDIYKRLKADFFLKDKVVVMLDNFTPADVKQVAPRLRRSGLFVEVSGGVTETNIAGYNVSGVSAISVGAITSKAPNLDMNLHFCF